MKHFPRNFNFLEIPDIWSQFNPFVRLVLLELGIRMNHHGYEIIGWDDHIQAENSPRKPVMMSNIKPNLEVVDVIVAVDGCG